MTAGSRRSSRGSAIGRPSCRRRGLELRDVGEPRLVRRIGVEVPVHEALRHLRHLADVRAVPALPLVVKDDEALVGHELADLLLADGDAVVPVHLLVDVAIAPGRVGARELLADRGAGGCALVGFAEALAVMVVGATLDPRRVEQRLQREGPAQGVDHPGLLPIREVPDVDAGVFFKMSIFCSSMAFSRRSASTPSGISRSAPAGRCCRTSSLVKSPSKPFWW